ncbi:MAG: hypothetical protein DMF94_18385 [Acidobacteria bacterium]|nr:MAG: hypothetical protein DMF94_18385 [Acidobacteriota bacterium]
MGVHGERRRRRPDDPRQSRRVQACAAAAAPSSRRDQGRHARRPVRHCVQQPDLPVPDGRRKVVPPGRRAGRRPCGQSARHAAVPFHRDLDRRRRCQQGSRPTGLVSALRAEILGSERAPPAARRSGRLRGDRAHRRQHHRPQQRNLPPHPSEGPDPVRRLPRGRARRRTTPDDRSADHARRARIESRHGLGLRRSAPQIHHGGRATETGRATIEALPEVAAEVGGRIPVFVDGGVRRGTDVFKALALGARGVGIGRPFLWGLGAFGEAGVDRVLEILQGELKLVMGNCGTRTVAEITRAYVATPDWKI